MKIPSQLAWAGALLTGAGLAAYMTYRGYKADELGTGGAPNGIELVLLGAFIVLLALAVAGSAAANRGRPVRVPTSHIVIAVIGAAVSLVVGPALVIPLGIVGYHVLRRPAPTVAH